jgi:hypothetical protein
MAFAASSPLLALGPRRSTVCGASGKGPHMAIKDRTGLTKEQVRRIVLSKLQIVYRDWAFAKGPFWHREPKAGQRRIDPRSFETALLAALLGGLSEAIEKNNQVLFTALGQRDQRGKAHTKRRKS